ncbi:LacI family DNA-binding transcriptional regulator [Isoptericola variabilis]|uniref:LacI family DNA-binding transcriptional regulator n=1 Tax=Isoptericola variabilis TaxID=139208 RepID=UPI003D1B1126
MTTTMQQVAVRASVSPATVSKFLNTPHRVAPLTGQRIAAAIEELGYVRNDAARQLRAGNSTTIGLLAFDVGNPFFVDLARRVEGYAASRGLSVLLANSDGSNERERGYLELFEQQRVHGVLVSPIGDVERQLERLHRREIPVVVVDKQVRPDLNASVSIDDVQGGYTAAAHLISRGCRRLMFVGGPTGLRQADDRLAGARRAVADREGVTIETVDVSDRSVDAGRMIGERILIRPPADRPDGVFAMNDRLAFGLLQTLVVEGRVRVPDEIAVIGYDDIEFAAAAVVPLSSIRQPRAEFARTAVELLEEPSPEPRQVVLEPELVVRESTRVR